MAMSIDIIDEAGTTHSLSDGTDTYTVEINGVGVASVTRILEEPINSSKWIDQGYRLTPRKMDLVLVFEKTTTSATDTVRDNISYIFQPTHNPLKLKITREDSAVRQIDVFLDGAIDYAIGPMHRDKFGNQKLVVPLVAPDPIWYDPTQQTSTLDLSSGSGTAVIDCTGFTWHDWPIIEIDGPITNLLINPSGFSNANLSFTSTIASGRTYTIDLRPGYKTITDDLATNKFSELSTSIVANMHGNLRIHSEKYLAANVSGSPTSTSIFFSGTSAGGTTEARVKYYKRYLGL